MKDEREVEKLLGQFSPRPGPRGLRERVIQAAEREAKARRILTPVWRWALASSFVLLAIFMLADWRISFRERNHLNSLLDSRGAEAPTPAEAAEQAAAEILASMPDLDPASRQVLAQSMLRDQSAAGRSRKAAPRLTEEINEY
jgi:hypothetical protein